MVMSGDSGDDGNAETFGRRCHSGDIEGIDGSSLVGGLVHKQIGIVIVADGDWDDLH